VSELKRAGVSGDDASVAVTSVRFPMESDDTLRARVPWAVQRLLLVAAAFGRREEEWRCSLVGLVWVLSESQRLVGCFSAGNRVEQQIVYFC